MSLSEDHSLRDDSTIISIQEVSEEEDENNLIQLHLSSGTAKISFHQFCKYSSFIQEELQSETNIRNILLNLEQKLQKYHIKDENVKIFFKIIKEEKVEITSNEYFDLYKLSEIFKVNSIKRLLKQYSKKFSQNLYFIINLMLEQKSEEFDELFPHDYISDDLENHLINNIEKCLTIEIFGQLPISTIYRIIDKSIQAKNISDDLLYDFISKSIEERHFLFCFLNIKKLSDEKFDDLHQNYIRLNDSKHYFDFLQKDLAFLKELKDDNKNLKNEVEQLRQLNDQLEKQQNQVKKENNQLQAQVNQLQSNNNQLKSQASKLEMQVKKLEEQVKFLTDQHNQMKEENDKLKVQVNDGNSDKNKLQNLVNQLTKENNCNLELKKKLETQVKLLTDQHNQMKSENDKLKVQINDGNSDKNKLQNLVNQLTKENKCNLELKKKFEEENKQIIIKNNAFEKQISEMKNEKINDKKAIEDNIVFRRIIEEFVQKFHREIEIKKSGIYNQYL